MKALEPEERISPIAAGEPNPYGFAESSAHPVSDASEPQPKFVEKLDNTERRRTPRIPCSGTAQIRQSGVTFPVWAELADVSLGGCYVQMIFTIPCKSDVDLQLTIHERSFSARGKVVTSHPGVGMGIQFTALTPENQKILAAIVQELASR